MPPVAPERSRDVVRWHSVDDLPWVAFESEAFPGFEGAAGRLLSESGDGSSQTWVVRAQPGWSAVVENRGVTELFVTEGQLRAAGEVLRVGGFIGIPEDAGAIEIASGEGATFLLFVNELFDSGSCYPGGTVRVMKSRELPWELHGVRGVAVKRLRPGRSQDPETSSVGFLNLLLFLPGFVSDEVEFHNTWEEMVYLDGDFFMVERGNAGAKSYHANPAGALHGPFGTQWGSLMLHHAVAPYRTEFDHREGGLERVAEYLDVTPYDSARPTTARWDAYSPASEKASHA